MPKADAEQETEIDQSAVQAALEKLKKMLSRKQGLCSFVSEPFRPTTFRLP